MTRSGFQPIDNITHRAALVGRTIDKRALTPLAGVVVTITSGPPAWLARVAALQQGQPVARPDQKITDAGGFFRWLDLPAGAYTLSASLPGTRYAAATGSLTLVSTEVGTLELQLAPTAVSGIVKAGSPATPLAMARVRFADSDDLGYTAADGSYTLSPIEAGTNRALEVSAQNFITTTQAVTLSQGQTTTAGIITLSRG
jgi:hypothetical protein